MLEKKKKSESESTEATKTSRSFSVKRLAVYLPDRLHFCAKASTLVHEAKTYKISPGSSILVAVRGTGQEWMILWKKYPKALPNTATLAVSNALPRWQSNSVLIHCIDLVPATRKELGRSGFEPLKA